MLAIFLLSITGAVISTIVSTFWYSDKTPMGKTQKMYLSLDILRPEEQMLKARQSKPKTQIMYGLQFVLSIMKAFFVVFVITLSVKNGVFFGSALIFPIFVWLCFDVTNIGSALLWSNCDRKIIWKKFYSDIFYNLTTILLIAFLTGIFL